MKLSWSHKLFLRVNSYIGKRPMFDKFMFFCGFWMIWILGIAFGGLLILGYIQNTPGNTENFFLFLASVVLSYIISYTIAILWKHERPIKELPQIKNLFPPFGGNWKSFPSDHAIATTLLALWAAHTTDSFTIAIFYFLGLLLVAFGRVYAGLHYPRDILGGIVVALIGFCSVVLTF